MTIVRKRLGKMTKYNKKIPSDHLLQGYESANAASEFFETNYTMHFYCNTQN